MAMKIATLDNLSTFLTNCKALFASQTEVEANDDDINTYVLDVKAWYENNMAFDTSEIV